MAKPLGANREKWLSLNCRGQWDYFWDIEFGRLYIFSTDSPSKLSNVIEYGVRERYIETVFADNTSIDGIDFYGARGGIGILAFNCWRL